MKLPVNERYETLRNGLIAMLIICVPVLTVSTVLWQWFG